MGFIIIIAIVVFVIAAVAISSAAEQNKRLDAKIAKVKLNEALESLPDFTVTKKIVGINNTYIFAVDENNKKIAIIRSSSLKTVIPFNQIYGVEISEDNTILQQKSSLRTIGGAVIGGAVAGGAGAVVGGLSGDVKQDKKVSKVRVIIKLRDINHPTYFINCFHCETMTIEKTPVKPSSSNGLIYKRGLAHAQQIADTISAIIDMTDREQKVTSQTNPQPQKTTGSVADELTKLAELKDKGILTEEEFLEQKKALLGECRPF